MPKPPSPQGGFDFPEIRSWSRDKLGLLRNYLHAYATIMRAPRQQKWLRSLKYIDAFAGPGEHLAIDTDEETQRYVDGSPLEALQCEPGFDSYLFIEQDPGRREHLQSTVRRDFPSRNVRVVGGDANTVLTEEVIVGIAGRSDIRGFVFLDPFGLQVDFETVKALAATHALDVFVNFSVMGVTRLLDRDRLPSAVHLATISRVMGSADWVDELYVRQPSLWGEIQRLRPGLDGQHLALRYATSLSTLFAHVSEPVLMRNSRNTPLYALMLASHKPVARRIADDIAARYERIRSGIS